MAYNNLIPQPTDRLRQSQPEILENYAVIPRAWDVNHVSFDAIDEGKHKWVTFPLQGADPVIGIPEIALYSKTSGLTGDSELFMRKTIGVGDIFYEWTSMLRDPTGWTILPSGLLIKWGVVALGLPAGLHATVYPVAANIPVFATSYLVLISGYHAGADAANVRLIDWTALQHRVLVTVPGGGTAPGYTWVAIGTT